MPRFFLIHYVGLGLGRTIQRLDLLKGYIQHKCFSTDNKEDCTTQLLDGMKDTQTFINTRKLFIHLNKKHRHGTSSKRHENHGLRHAVIFFVIRAARFGIGIGLFIIASTLIALFSCFSSTCLALSLWRGGSSTRCTRCSTSGTRGTNYTRPKYSG